MSGGCCDFGGGFGGAGGATPAGGILVADDGVLVSPDPFTELDFVGGGVAVSDAGGGVATVEIPGTTYLEEGVAIANPPHINLNVTGAGATISDAGANTALLNIPGNAAYVPEQWVVNDVPADQTRVAMDTLVSSNFATFKVVRAGSITGLVTRLTEAITAGTLLVEVILNGAFVAGAPAVTHDSGTNPSGGQMTVAPGLIPYVAGDLIGVRYSTTADFLPITTDLEAAVSVFEVP